jgi:hypothetical protein
MKYYIGDPCYVLRDETWDAIIESQATNPQQTVHVINGQECYLFLTAHGDGMFDLKRGDEVIARLGVDAGMIGAVPVEAMTAPESAHLGHIADLPLLHPTICHATDQGMTFGPLTVEEGRPVTKVRALVRQHVKVPFPPDFGADGNALSLISVTQQALRRAKWPEASVSEFRDLTLECCYEDVITCCLTCFLVPGSPDE